MLAQRSVWVLAEPITSHRKPVSAFQVHQRSLCLFATCGKLRCKSHMLPILKSAPRYFNCCVVLYFLHWAPVWDAPSVSLTAVANIVMHALLVRLYVSQGSDVVALILLSMQYLQYCFSPTNCVVRNDDVASVVWLGFSMAWFSIHFPDTDCLLVYRHPQWFLVSSVPTVISLMLK